MRYQLLATTLICVAAQPLVAQQTGVGEMIGTVILDGVIPSGQMTYSRAYSVDVISGAALRATGEALVSDVLARQAGLSLSRNGGLGQTTTLRMRGLGSEYIAVRIDGIEVNDPSNPENFFDFGQLTSAGVSRIEILRGAQSAAFGSDAVGGVINLVTARPETPGQSLDVAAELGSQATRRVSLGYGATGERAEFAFTASSLTTDGISAADENDGNAEADGFDQTQLTFSAAFQATEDVRIGASGFRIDSEGEYDATFPEFADGTPDDVSAIEVVGAACLRRDPCHWHRPHIRGHPV